MKTKVLLLMTAVALLLSVSSCKKQHGQWTKHVVTEEYEYVEQEETTKLQDEAPKLRNWKAKSLAKAAFEEAKITKSPDIVQIDTGYYECRNEEMRENLYKAQANGLLNVTYSEIKNRYDKSTYWVEVSLTPEGKSLIVVEDKTTLYPEDTINIEYMNSVITPNTGRNQYGEYTRDTNIDGTIIKLIQDFYNTYVTDKEAAIANYGTKDLIDAQARINNAKDLGINRMQKDPFVRNLDIDTANVKTIAVAKWTDYIDLYVVNIDNHEYCIVIKDENGIKKIDDIAIQAPQNLKQKNTLRCVALGISAKELNNAQIRKNKAEEAKAKRATTKKTTKKVTKKVVVENEEIEEVEEIEEESYFAEYTPSLQPGIEEVERTEPTLYELAKEREYKGTVNLLAGDFKFKKISKLRDVKSGEYDIPVKKAIGVVERTKVSPLGRIFFGLKEKEKVSYDLIFYYENEEWACKVVGRH